MTGLAHYDVMIRLTPNWPTKVGTITVRGNEEVDAATIGNSITLQTGKPFRYTDLAESQRNLYESNLFRMAVFSVPPRLSEHGFPHMPLYGAMTWWFFFAIPLIGLTWGFFNDWKGDRKYRDVR